MRTLIVEQSIVVTVPASDDPEPSITIGTPTLRPRLEGYRTALRGPAFSANYIDSAKVLYTITPTTSGGLAALQALGAQLTVEQIPLLGGAPDRTFVLPLSTDVSGALTLSRGRLSTDLSVNGVVRTSLQLTNLSSLTALQFLVQVQIFGDQRAIDVEGVGDLENPALPNGMALAQLLDG